MKLNQDIIIHGGWNKTGTTFLQKRVFPAITQRCLCGPGSRIQSLQLFKDHSDPIVISDESLLGTTIYQRVKSRNEQRINFLRSWASISDRTRFILCIRKHASLIESLYRQYLHGGGALAPNAFFSLTGNSFLTPQDFLFHPTLTCLYDNFPGPHLIYDYNTFKADPVSTCVKIAKFINPLINVDEFKSKISEKDSTRRDNESISYRRGLLLRQINKLVSSRLNRGKIPYRLVKFLLFGYTPREILQKPSRSGDKRKFYPPATVDQINQYFQEDWENSLKFCEK